MGDNWEHELHLEKLLPAGPAVTYPRFVDGAGRCPPEDVGGTPGFHNFLDALENPKHPDYEELSDWYGARFDAADLDQEQIRKRLAKIGAAKIRKRV